MEVDDWNGYTCVTGMTPAYRPSLLEIGGTFRVTQFGVKRGWYAHEGISLENGYDLTTGQGTGEAWTRLLTAKPDVLIISWPSDPWCTYVKFESKEPDRLQRIVKRRREHRRMTHFLADVIAWQVARGGYFICENPQSSDSWKLPEFQKM